MMLLGTAFMLGLVGSLHCAGMCGPLALAVPVLGTSRPAIVASRLLHNLGRITTYVLLGLLFGLLGRSLALAGLQRWVSLAAGALILTGLLATSRLPLGLPVTRLVGRVKGLFGQLLRRRSAASLFGLGLLNGLLPCGLVYVAATAALATGSPYRAAGFMAVFGLGTVPALFALGVAGTQLQQRLRFRWQKLVPASLVCVGALLLLRGLALGIPYLSPADPNEAGSCPLCPPAAARATVACH